MRSKAKTVDEYLAELAPDRRAALQTLRQELRRHLDPLLEEVMQYGMISYVIPHRVYPPGYHCQPADPLPFLSLASQKNNLALYVMAIAIDRQLSAWLDQAWKATGHRLDRGASCIRFRSPDQIPWNVLAELLTKLDVPSYLQMYEQGLKRSAKTRGTKPKTTVQKKRAARPRRGTTALTDTPSPGPPRETHPAKAAQRWKDRGTQRGKAAVRGRQPAAVAKAAASPLRGSARRSGRG
ncbi:MAG: DUF1801 domain-containing protein [Planctomycetaceae bacterium]